MKRLNILSLITLAIILTLIYTNKLVKSYDTIQINTEQIDYKINETLKTYDSPQVEQVIYTEEKPKVEPATESKVESNVEPNIAIKVESNEEQNINKLGSNLLIFPDGVQKSWVQVPHSLAQSTIDKNPTVAVTDQDTIFNPHDNLATHFSAHIYGGYQSIINLQIDQIVTVTDNLGNAYNYKVVDKNYIDCLANGKVVDDNDYDWIFNAIESGYGESILLQTCTRLNADNSFSVVAVVATKI